MLVLDSYINLLRSHDWSYEWSDDPAVFKRGSEERQALRQMQTQCDEDYSCLLYTSPSPRDGLLSRMPSSA